MTYTQRAAGVLHRSGLSAIDKLAAPAAPTVADITTGGALLANTNYKAAVAAYTAPGVSVASATGNVSTAADASNTHGLRVAVAQIAGALGYDIFASVDVAPKWVGRVTEAQRAAGVAIRAVGSVGGDQAADVAGKIRTALAASAFVNAAFVVSGATTAIILTDRTKRANDTTLNIAISDPNALGVTAAPTSANTTAGVAPVPQVETATVAGTITTAGNGTITVTANGMTNSPKAVSVALALNDTAALMADKIRVALAADVDVAAFFTVSGTTTAVILTAKIAAANDATMNIAQIDGTSVGLTTAATSANTTAGVAGTAQVETATVPTSLVTTSGNITVTVTGANLYNSPAVVSVAVSAASGVAGSVDVFVAGTGVASTAAPFAVGNAYTPSLVTPVNCGGFSKAYVMLKVKPTFAAVPSISLLSFIQNNSSLTDFHQLGAVVTPSLLVTVGQNLEQTYEVDVDGALGLVVLCEAISNCTADIWIELA